MDGVRHWLVLVRTARVLVRAARLTTLDRLGTLDRWRAVDEYGFVLDIFLQRHRDTEAAKTFLTRLLGEYDVPEVIHTDQLRSYGAAIREIPSLVNVDHQQVISTARCNNIIEQSHRPTRRQERSQQGFRRRKRAQEFLSLHARIENLHHHSRTSVSAQIRRNNQMQAFQTWSVITAGVALTSDHPCPQPAVTPVRATQPPEHVLLPSPFGRVEPALLRDSIGIRMTWIPRSWSTS